MPSGRPPCGGGRRRVELAASLRPLLELALSLSGWLAILLAGRLLIG
jgi:hypothetical protein